MDRSIRSRTSSTSSVRSPVVPSTPTPTPNLSTQASRVQPQPDNTGSVNRCPGDVIPCYTVIVMLYRDQLAASLSRLRAERALSTPATPAPTPTPHPGQVLMLVTILRGEMCRF